MTVDFYIFSLICVGVFTALTYFVFVLACDVRVCFVVVVGVCVAYMVSLT